MTTAANKAFKTEIQYGDGATPEEFTTVAEVFGIDPPEAASETGDVTSHDSTKAEFINVGCVDEGEISLDCNWVNDTTDTAVRAKLGGAASNWQLCLPNWGARTATFTANVNDTLTATDHGLTTGQPFRVSTSNTLPDPLAASTTYYAIYLTADTFKAATTNANAVAGTPVNITSTGTGTQTLQAGNKLSFAGLVHVNKLGPLGIKDKQTVNFKVKITDGVTWA